MLSTALDGIDLAAPLTEVVTFVGDQVTVLLPIGIGIVVLLAAPRIVRRLINTFI